jgi:hypothetical protein
MQLLFVVILAPFLFLAATCFEGNISVPEPKLNKTVENSVLKIYQSRNKNVQWTYNMRG